MRGLIDTLEPYPYLAIEPWTGLDGWWTFKVLFITGPNQDDRDPLDAEFPEIGPARTAASLFPKANGNCPVIEDIR
jgi:hypothetical protein